MSDSIDMLLSLFPLGSSLQRADSPFTDCVG